MYVLTHPSRQCRCHGRWSHGQGDRCDCRSRRQWTIATLHACRSLNTGVQCYTMQEAYSRPCPQYSWKLKQTKKSPTYGRWPIASCGCAPPCDQSCTTASPPSTGPNNGCPHVSLSQCRLVADPHNSRHPKSMRGTTTDHYSSCRWQ
jgi:hypothetical protein